MLVANPNMESAADLSANFARRVFASARSHHRLFIVLLVSLSPETFEVCPDVFLRQLAQQPYGILWNADDVFIFSPCSSCKALDCLHTGS
jgi:hypothetical protein